MGFARNVPISPLIMRHQSQRDLPVGPTAQTNQPKLWAANDDIPTGNLLSLHNMHPNTNQQPIYSLHEDSSLTIPSRSHLTFLLRAETCNFSGNIPRASAGDVITEIWHQMSGTRCVWNIGSGNVQTKCQQVQNNP